MGISLDAVLDAANDVLFCIDWHHNELAKLDFKTKQI